jgi:hypothetical protein
MLEGYDILRKLELIGSTSGKPTKIAKIIESGELPGGI